MPALTLALHCLQVVAIVHQDVDLAQKAAKEVRLQVWPFKGAIQIEDGVLQEQSVYRQEANISMFVLVAYRLHMAVTEVTYKKLVYRRRNGGHEATHYYYKVSMLEEAAAEVLSKDGAATKGDTPGWSEVQTGSLQGSGEDWIVMRGTIWATCSTTKRRKRN